MGLRICVKATNEDADEYGKEVWLDIPCDEDDIVEELYGEELEDDLDTSYEIVDYECEEDEDDRMVDFMRTMDFDELNDVASWWDRLSSYNQEAFFAICEAAYPDNFSANQSILDSGSFDFRKGSIRDAGEELLAERICADCWQQVRPYIDFEQYAEDQGFVEVENGWIEIY